MPRFLDTNILLRYLTRDDEEKAQACLGLLQSVDSGEEEVVTSDLVVAEVVFTLQSRRYGLGREEIRDLVMPILSLRGLRLPQKRLYPRVFDLYCGTGISFADAYNAALMERRGLKEIYSYDTDFDRIEGLVRVEP